MSSDELRIGYGTRGNVEYLFGGADLLPSERDASEWNSERRFTHIYRQTTVVSSGASYSQTLDGLDSHTQQSTSIGGESLAAQRPPPSHTRDDSRSLRLIIPIFPLILEFVKPDFDVFGFVIHSDIGVFREVIERGPVFSGPFVEEFPFVL